MAIPQPDQRAPSNWLVASLAPEPDLGALEELYRKAVFPADAMQLKRVAWITYLAVLVFTWNDYQIIGFSARLALIYFVRLVSICLTWLMLEQMPTIARSNLALDRTVLAWGFLIMANVLFIDSTRPSNFFFNVPLNILMIVMLHVTIPNRYTYRLVQSVVFTIVSFLFFFKFRADIGAVGVGTFVASYLAANFLGWITSTWMHRLRRNQFLAHHREHLARLEIERLAMIDQLTQVYNRRRFMELAEAELERFHRYGHAFCVMYVDLDNFKQINDAMGHSVGDAVLKQFATFLAGQIRVNDLVGRLGGDEFSVLTPETDLLQATELAERICCTCNNLVVHTPASQVRLSVCIGVAAVSYADQSMDNLLHRADLALYDAKSLGGGRAAMRELPDH